MTSTEDTQHPAEPGTPAPTPRVTSIIASQLIPPVAPPDAAKSAREDTSITPTENIP
jgi:hypothetical protein